MTKMIKMSLVAAVAVAGFTTSASAMDTSYTGKVYVENHATSVNDGQTVTGYDIDFDVKATTKINDNFSAVVGVQADADTKDNVAASASAVTMDKANINYAGNGLTVKFGRQAINTPTTDGETVEGILATYGVAKGITLAAAHFGNQSIAEGAVAGQDAHAVAVLGSMSGVNFQLWNVGVAGHSVNNTLVVGANVAGIALGARYATTDFEAGTDKDGSTMILSAAGKAGTVGLSAAYLVNGEDNAAFTSDASSANTAELVEFNAQNAADTKAFILGVSAPMTSTLSASVKYGSADIGANNSISEVVLQLTNKFAKSLTGTVRYADYTGVTSDTDQTQLRADMTYKF